MCKIGEIGCILMASGLSRRFGRNKLLERLEGREIVLRAADSLIAAGLRPLTVTRSGEIEALMRREGIACARHDGARKSDTIHVGLERLPPDLAGWLFMPADQPLVLPETIRRLTEQFFRAPSRAVRLGFGDAGGSPVLFPAACREDLLAYAGDRGGAEVLQQKRIPCDVVGARFAWELWDADTPEALARISEAFTDYSR